MRSLFWIFLAMVVVGCGRTPQGDISDNASAVAQDPSLCALGSQAAECVGTTSTINPGSGLETDSPNNNNNNGPVTIGGNPSVPPQGGTPAGSPSTGSPSSSSQTTPSGQAPANPAPPVVQPTISYQTVNCDSVGTTTTVPHLIFWTKTITTYSEVKCALDATTFRVEDLKLSAECKWDSSFIFSNSEVQVNAGCKATLNVAKLPVNHSEILIVKEKEVICSAATTTVSTCKVDGPIINPRLNQVLSGNCQQGDYGFVMNLLWVKNKCAATFDVEYEGIHGE